MVKVFGKVPSPKDDKDWRKYEAKTVEGVKIMIEYGYQWWFEWCKSKCAPVSIQYFTG